MEEKEYFKELERLRRRRALLLLLTLRWGQRKLLLRKGKYRGQEWCWQEQELWTRAMRELNERQMSPDRAA
jgi:hypothetical protein